MKTGKWIKAEIPENGVYKISYSKLRGLGFTNPETVRIFCGETSMLPFMNGSPRATGLSEISLHRENDAVYFYASGADFWSYDENDEMYLVKKHLFSDNNYYFLTDIDTGKDNTIKNSTQSTSAQTITEGDFYYSLEEDLVNLQMSGRDWFGENFFYNTSQNFMFSCNNAPEKGKIKFSAIARSSASNSFTVTVSNASKSAVCDRVSNSGLYASRVTESFDFEPEKSENQTVTVTFNKTSPSAEGYLDWIVLNTAEPLKYNGKQLIFSRYFYSDQTAEISINGNTTIWNITDYLTPVSGRNVVCQKGKNDFAVFNMSDAFEVKNFENIENQDLHGMETPEYLIIVPKIFLTEAQRLKQIHTDLKTEAVEVEKIYNEFSSGKTDVSAVRDFIRFLYKKNGRLKYVLLFGDGSVDNKTVSKNNTNLLPTYQSPNSLNENNLDSFVSDDFFGLLDDDEGEFSGDLDVGIGRLPAKSIEEASILVDKIKNYVSKNCERSWKQNVCFVADDGDNNLHASQADFIAENLEQTNGGFNIKKIYTGWYKQVSSAAGNTYPKAKEDIINAFNSGASVINYTGHGGMNFFADERILTNSDLDGLTNKTRLPLFITASCNIGHFDYYDRISDKSVLSPAEHCLLNPKGGAIAMFTTTRNVLAKENFELNKNIFRHLFNKENRFGDIIRKAKNETGDNNKLNFTLLGDPALALETPDYEIKILSINGKPFDENFSDTIKALGNYEIKAEIQGAENFSGTGHVCIFDKTQKITSAENNEYQAYTIKIFEGVSTVKNGMFSFKFLVPKDIDYQRADFGKIILYADNQDFSASGFSKQLKIGGCENNAEDDKQGPKIKLYLDGESFQDGGKTGDSPTLIAEISDTSGINVTQKHSGHDITLTLDNNNETYSLTDYYKYNKDSYTSGKIEYSLKKLSKGNHTLKLKAWDNFNNSSEAELSFFVAENEALKITRLFNYPNPFTDFTKFYFEHNNPQSVIDYELTVFTLSGKTVRVLTGSFSNGQSLSEPIEWDGLDKFSNRCARGVYFYRLKIKDSDGKKASKYEKLLYLK
jgi:hypothetical protein